MSTTVIIALGTNLGERVKNLSDARAGLALYLRIDKISPIYETEPWGYADQPMFLNQVILGETTLTPQELLKTLKSIEQRMGREKTFKNGPRLIDLDLISYGNLILDTEQLKIPHPGLQERAFVLVPLLDIAPDWEHPVLKQQIRTLAKKVDQQGVILFDQENYREHNQEEVFDD